MEIKKIKATKPKLELIGFGSRYKHKREPRGGLYRKYAIERASIGNTRSRTKAAQAMGVTRQKFSLQ
jgi:hypothetical protein